MITEVVCEVEGCGARARVTHHHLLPEGWAMVTQYVKPKTPARWPEPLPADVDFAAPRERAVCSKHELPKFIDTGPGDEPTIGVLHSGRVLR